MFKGFQKGQQFKGFPALNFQMNNEAYGFSGCTFWLDAAYGLNTQTDLAAVSSWQTRIGGITFIQSTAGNQPRLVLSNVNFNNFPTIEGQDTARRMNAILGLNIPNNYTIVFIGNYNTLNSVNIIMGATVGNDSIGMGGINAPVTGVYKYNTLGNNFVMGTTNNTSAKICVLTNERLIVNNSQQSSTTSQWSNQFNQIFCALSNNGNGLTGNIAEIIIFYRTFTSSQCSEISNNVNSKYAIY